MCIDGSVRCRWFEQLELESVVFSLVAALTTRAMLADDTTLLASSRKDIAQKIKDTKVALARRGLKLNLDKCKVQTNRTNAKTKPLLIDGEQIPMVTSTEGVVVLGTVFTLTQKTSAELRARIAAA